MYKKFTSIFISLIMVLTFSSSIFAQSKSKSDFTYSTEMNLSKGEIDKEAKNNTASNNGKIIIIDINRVNLDNMRTINAIKKRMNKASIALMNIRGDKGYDDRRNYASMGSTGRVNIDQEKQLIISNSSQKEKNMYKHATGLRAESINLLNINDIDAYNQTKGEYKSKIGILGDTLKSANKKISVLGNSDYINEEGQFVKNRDFALSLMDSKGRIENGVLDDLNIEDSRYPYGFRTDYDKLLEGTKKYYNSSDVLMVNLGDTFRYDEYKVNLNEKTKLNMKRMVYSDVNKYLEQVFNMAGSNDTIYVIGSFPSKVDFKNNKRLGSVIRFDMSEKTAGLLTSSTTRRKGLITNTDIGADILNRMGIKNSEMNGRVIKSVPKHNHFEFLKKDYEKIVSIATMRMDIINIYVVIIVISWVLGALALWQRHKLPIKHKKTIIIILKEMIKLGLIMPLAFQTAPIFNASSKLGVSMAILFVSLVYYVIATMAFKGKDMRQLGFYALIMIGIIVVDSILSTPLMSSNVMSYDPIMGARYYGIGNEYEGVTVGSAILGIAILLEYKKIPKLLLIPIMIFILFTSAYPAMGANVGGAISETIAYLVFVLLVFNIKIDFKKTMMIGISTFALVAVFAVADIALGMGSHLGNFVKQIMNNGPMEIIYVFARKIDMNIQLAQTTVWVNILLVGLAFLALTIFRPNKEFVAIKKEYPIIYKGFLSIMVGCIITLLVNDSGIIAAATDSIYLLIPIIIILMNKKLKLEDTNVIR
ncbi:hypothetical protein [Peptostreptococcus equinus]|uniref:Alkaline phosphatase n=1 Tax=Peptostreptococcus equinus TaxID=3003601 RepID=A0ABY7JQ09_9FIRM|nr:hypothetical protein [Peptostreptococcus sp. CBA3647]WAW14042.1 hypothetical protein O0R46_05400 [Peptostreptococcus sp. CBA3647]